MKQYKTTFNLAALAASTFTLTGNVCGSAEVDVPCRGGVFY